MPSVCPQQPLVFFLFFACKPCENTFCLPLAEHHNALIKGGAECRRHWGPCVGCLLLPANLSVFFYTRIRVSNVNDSQCGSPSLSGSLRLHRDPESEPESDGPSPLAPLTTATKSPHRAYSFALACGPGPGPGPLDSPRVVCRAIACSVCLHVLTPGPGPNWA